MSLRTTTHSRGPHPLPDAPTQKSQPNPGQTLLVLAHPGLHVHRIAITRNTPRPLHDAVRVEPRPSTPDRVWTILDTITVANRLVGIQIRRQLLDLIDPWRVSVPLNVMPVGGTQAWLDAAPMPRLAVLATGSAIQATAHWDITWTGAETGAETMPLTATTPPVDR